MALPSSAASAEPSSSEAGAPSPAAAEDGRRRRAVALGRWALLSAAALALASALALSRERDRDRGRAGLTSGERYLCPMHPEVLSRARGDCPICRMALVRARASPEELARAALERGAAVAEVERRAVTQLVRAPAWLSPEGAVTAILHRDELVGLARDERALFFPSAAPGAGIPVRRSSPEPGAWDASTVQVRFQAEAPVSGRDLGWLQLAARPREILVVPASAVLYSGEGAYALAAPPGAPFARRSIEIGRILDSGHAAALAGGSLGSIAVLAGLEEGERVVAGDAFFHDAERRLRAAQERAAEDSP